MHGVIQKVPEAHRRYYIILRHTRMVQSTRHNGSKWIIMERSGRFWVMVQRIEEQKEINEVRYFEKSGRNIL